MCYQGNKVLTNRRTDMKFSGESPIPIRTMRILVTLYILTYLANIAFAFGSLLWLPCMPWCIECIVVALVISHVVALHVILCLFLSSKWCLSLPSSWWGVPNSIYWRKEENFPEAMRRYRLYIWRTGIAVMLFLLFFQWESFRHNNHGGLPNDSLFYAIGIFVAVVAIDTVYLTWRFSRVPKDDS